MKRLFNPTLIAADGDPSASVGRDETARDGEEQACAASDEPVRRAVARQNGQAQRGHEAVYRRVHSGQDSGSGRRRK